MLHTTWACDGISTWEKLAIIKEDDPVLVAEYIVSNDLRRNPKWRYKWAKRYLFKIKQLGRALGMNLNIVQPRATNKKATKEMHGIPIPKNGKQALDFDKQFGNKKWSDAIKKEIATMIEFKVFKIHKNRPHFPTEEGWQFAPLHWVYAIKHNGRHKARIVIGGHVTDAEG